MKKMNVSTVGFMPAIDRVCTLSTVGTYTDADALYSMFKVAAWHAIDVRNSGVFASGLSHHITVIDGGLETYYTLIPHYNGKRWDDAIVICEGDIVEHIEL